MTGPEYLDALAGDRDRLAPVVGRRYRQAMATSELLGHIYTVHELRVTSVSTDGRPR